MNTLFDIYLCLTRVLVLPELCSIIVKNIDDYHSNIFDSMLKDVITIASPFQKGNTQIPIEYCKDRLVYKESFRKCFPKVVDTKQKISTQKLKDGTNVTIYTGWLVFGNNIDYHVQRWNELETFRKLKYTVQQSIKSYTYIQPNLSVKALANINYLPVINKINQINYLTIPQSSEYYQLFMCIERRIDQYGSVRHSKNRERKIANALRGLKL